GERGPTDQERGPAVQGGAGERHLYGGSRASLAWFGKSAGRPTSLCPAGRLSFGRIRAVGGRGAIGGAAVGYGRVSGAGGSTGRAHHIVPSYASVQARNEGTGGGRDKGPVRAGPDIRQTAGSHGQVTTRTCSSTYSFPHTPA